MTELNEDFDIRSDQLKKIGQAYIQSNWELFQSKTRSYLENNGYDKNGYKLNEFEDYSSQIDIENFEYSIGMFKEVVSLNIPTKVGDSYSSIMIDNDLVINASNFLSPKNSYDNLDFANLIILALIKRQATLTFSYLIDNKMLNKNDNNLFFLTLRFLSVIFFSIAFPLSITQGIIETLSKNVFNASALFFFALFSFNVLKKEEEIKRIEIISHEKWCGLLCQDYPIFHIGNGRGLEIKLKHMAYNGIYVPTIIFDYCYLLQKRFE